MAHYNPLRNYAHRLELTGTVTDDGELLVTAKRFDSSHGRRELETSGPEYTEVDGAILALFAGERVRVTIQRLEAHPCQTDQTRATSPGASLSESPEPRTGPSKHTEPGSSGDAAGT